MRESSAIYPVKSKSMVATACTSTLRRLKRTDHLFDNPVSEGHRLISKSSTSIAGCLNYIKALNHLWKVVCMLAKNVNKYIHGRALAHIFNLYYDALRYLHLAGVEYSNSGDFWMVAKRL